MDIVERVNMLVNQTQQAINKFTDKNALDDTSLSDLFPDFKALETENRKLRRFNAQLLNYLIKKIELINSALLYFEEQTKKEIELIRENEKEIYKKSREERESLQEAIFEKQQYLKKLEDLQIKIDLLANLMTRIADLRNLTADSYQKLSESLRNYAANIISEPDRYLQISNTKISMHNLVTFVSNNLVEKIDSGEITSIRELKPVSKNIIHSYLSEQLNNASISKLDVEQAYHAFWEPAPGYEKSHPCVTDIERCIQKVEKYEEKLNMAESQFDAVDKEIDSDLKEIEELKRRMRELPNAQEPASVANNPSSLFSSRIAAAEKTLQAANKIMEEKTKDAENTPTRRSMNGNSSKDSG